MKKLTSMILALLILTTGLALAESWQPAELTWTESVTYHGDGVFEINFMKDIPWRTQYAISVKDESGTLLPFIVLGGDAGRAVLQVQGGIRENELYSFIWISADNVIHSMGQTSDLFTYANYCEYCLQFGHGENACDSRQAAGAYDVDRCDLCGDLDHDEEFCPTRQSGEYCDECAEYGHDDEACPVSDEDDPYDRCDLCGALGHDDERCTGRVQATPAPVASTTGQTAKPQSTAAPTPVPTRTQYCDDCREYGHDDDHCPYEWCDYCGSQGHDDDHCPSRTCKRCGENGHSGDDCPTKRCDECGKTGHDDDHCPDERCDECGKTGHDDDHCPDERCDECGKTGHDDDHCPYDRDDD